MTNRKEKRRVLGMVLAHPGHDPVYDAFMAAFRHLGWIVETIVSPKTADIYRKWQQPFPDCQRSMIIDGDGVHLEQDGVVDNEQSSKGFSEIGEQDFVKSVSDLATERFDFLIYDDYNGRPEIFRDYFSRCPSLLVAHNLRGAFEKYPGRGFDVIEKNRPRRAGMRRLDGMIVLSETIWNFAHKEFNPVKPLFWMPDSLHLLQRAIAENHASDDNRKIFAIPGNLTTIRKEYPPVFEMLAGLKTETRRKTEFRFIGGIGDDSGKEVASKLENLKNGGVPLEYSEELLTDAEFEQKMQNVDALILPAPHTIQVGNFTEEYNKTKISGTVGHQIRRGLPVIQPDWCPADNVFAESTSFYENGSDLLTHIEHLVNDEAELRVMKELALQSAREFTPEKIGEHLKKHILEPMNLI